MGAPRRGLWAVSAAELRERRSGELPERRLADIPQRRRSVSSGRAASVTSAAAPAGAARRLHSGSPPVSTLTCSRSLRSFSRRSASRRRPAPRPR